MAMIKSIVELSEELQNNPKLGTLSGSLKVNLGDDGVIFIDGSSVSNQDGAADCTITTKLATFNEIYHGEADLIQAHYQHRALIEGSHRLASQLTALMDNAEGPSRRISRFPGQANASDIARALKSTGAVVVENCISDKIADRVAAELRPHFDECGEAYQPMVYDAGYVLTSFF